jgi:hypothetical protein
LLHQTVAAKVVINGNFSAEHILRINQALMKAVSLEQLLRLIWNPTIDRGPATKFLPVLEKLKNTETWVFVCDDDHWYSPYLVESLLKYSRKDAAVGARGWRIDESFRWGTPPSYHGWEIMEPWQVGILTANQGYLLLSSWFKDSDIFDYSKAPLEAQAVDDIWINGHLAKLGIQRFIVPLPVKSHGLPSKSAIFESKENKKPFTRRQANDVTLQYFSEFFSKEAIFHSKTERPVPV